MQLLHAFTAGTVRKSWLTGQISFVEDKFAWIFACSCEEIEQLQKG